MLSFRDFINESRWNFEPIKAKSMDDYSLSIIGVQPKEFHRNGPKQRYHVAHYQKLPSGNHSGVASTEFISGRQFVKKMKNLEYPVGYFSLTKEADFINSVTGHRKSS